MRYLVILLLVLLAATTVALLVQDDPGYAALTYGSWTVETSLAVLLATVVVGYGAVYFLLRLLLAVWRLPRRMRDYRRRRRSELARQALNQGLIDLAEGRWESAERLLGRHAADSDNPLINYLGAARAAGQLEAHDRRDNYLRLAHESTPGADIAVGLTQAELQLSHRQSEQALATLTRLHGLSPRHGYVLKLLARLHRRLADWDKLAAILPELRRRRVVPDQQLDAWEREAHIGRLELAARRGDPAALTAVWDSLPKRLREDAGVFRVYVDGLRAMEGGAAAAEQRLRARLDRQWDEGLAELYGEIALADPARQLEHAEGWLKDHAHSPGLLRSLGRLCARTRLWGKARGYYEAAIGLRPDPRTYLELGDLLERQIGDSDAARECYRKGLALDLAQGGTAVALAPPGRDGASPASDEGVTPLAPSLDRAGAGRPR